VSSPIRYAILDHASDDCPLWEISWGLQQSIDGHLVEIHPRLPVQEVMPHLLDLLREGHVEVYRYDEPQEPSLSLEHALAVTADAANWDPATAKPPYGVVTTESGDREFRIEYEAARQD
jgi:hypothetical protein